ncbi:MAG: DEAD/DEAH box helicase [Nitrospinota bacterium]|nr:DEAD/DEAH box helicase [Nitrospinota bacterium]MDH5756343.1 DEAD/DEAH box helicase [Nitrospinota bacterium]
MEKVDIVEPEDALPVVDFDGLPEELKQAALDAGWNTLMPVQARAIPYVRAKRDMMIQSRTGSGKTGAFVLPMVDRLDPTQDNCQALILAPTRELAVQVAENAETLCRAKGLRTIAVYGGVGYAKQIDAFRQGAHIVIGTPGRVLDHLLSRNLSLDKLKMLVFDEADRMLSMGFYPDMKRLQGFLPKRRIQTLMFSATFPTEVLRLANQFLKDQGFLSLSQKNVHAMNIEHVFYVTPGMEKDIALTRIIEVENPSAAIIFCNTKAQVHYVSVVLKRFGYDADEISADLSQAAREKTLNKVRKGRLRFLVATDVAARGIDIPELSHVILYEPPDDPESYIHRAGRTGRAGAGGEAISLVTDMEKKEMDRIARKYGIDMQERPLPTEGQVETLVAERVTALLEARLRSRDQMQAKRLNRFLPLAQALGQDKDECAVLAMLLDDYYQQTLHAPPPIPMDEAPGAVVTGHPIEEISQGKRPKRHRSGRRRRED